MCGGVIETIEVADASKTVREPKGTYRLRRAEQLRLRMGALEKVFHCVPAQHEPRIDGVVVELEHLGERVERDRDEPVD